MKKIIIGLLFFFTTSLNYASNSFKLEITTKLPLGTIHYASENFDFSWKIKKGNKTLAQKSIPKYYKSYSIFIVQVKGNTKIVKLPSNVNQYSWKIPNTKDNSIFAIHVDATPKDNRLPRLRGSTHVYTSTKTSLKPPVDFSSSLTVLMDWNGKRGFYNQLDSLSALKYAKETCIFIRKNFTTDEYAQYLEIIEKIEKTKIAPITIYCKIERAKLDIDGNVVGFFEERDSINGMYYLTTNLPINIEKPYKIQAQKKDTLYKGFQVHAGASEHIVGPLVKLVEMVIESQNLDFKILSKTENITWQKQHSIVVPVGKVETLYMEIKGYKKIKIHFIPKEQIYWKIKQENNNFYLIADENKYELTGNTLNLIDF